MKITPYHSKYIAYDLTRRTGDGLDRISMSLFDAAVDMNPHQIEAALFAMQSPLSKGAILADEVGLGKTIEAGIVICQYWAERKRSILIITPASIRKQWGFELEEKFHLPVLILDKKSYNAMQKAGKNPLTQKKVIIISYHFASRMKAEIGSIKWDLVVIDEAHKLRNAYRDSNVMGQAIKQATGDSKKLLLTATPLQNSLLELYGLTSFIDDTLFGDVNSFRSRFMTVAGDLEQLRSRIVPVCKRTLRKQVTEYVQYTRRKALTEPFDPTDDEHRFYEAVSAFLQRSESYAIPKRQRHLTQMILRKLLASSTEAVAATFNIMLARLEKIRLKNRIANDSFVENILESEEMEDDLLEEILADDGETSVESEEDEIDECRLNEEIAELKRLAEWACQIKVDSKSKALLFALSIGFQKMTEMGAARKAVVFTESRRTQEYLKEYLAANGYAGETICFNGTNKGAETTAIYETWLTNNVGTGRISGTRDIDIRTALLDHFRQNASILIATEAAAEGINLQFCSLVINYDLPWNPQRIEQRIGRCHRYGQKHDVVVINFLNKRNDADRRVLELLTEKFQLFDGVFGASDEILGTVESGIDFERSVLNIYQQCRTPKEIEAAFLELRKQMEETIRLREDKTRKILLEHFDEDVHERLRIKAAGTKALLDRFGKRFWDITRFELGNSAEFHEDEQSFDLIRSPVSEAKTGRYYFISARSNRSDAAKSESNVGETFLYRLSHPLGEYVLNRAKESATPYSGILFRLDRYPKRISLLESLVGKSGYLTLTRLVIQSFEEESYLLFNGFLDDGTPLDQETCEKLFHLKGDIFTAEPLSAERAALLDADRTQHVQAAEHRSMETNNRYFSETQERLDKWADDQIDALEANIRKVKTKLRDSRNKARQAETMAERLTCEKESHQLERTIRKLRNERDDREEEIEAKREDLIEQIRRRLRGGERTEALFTIRWSVK